MIIVDETIAEIVDERIEMLRAYLFHTDLNAAVMDNARYFSADSHLAEWLRFAQELAVAKAEVK